MATPESVHLRDTRANQPAAAVGNTGVLFCVTDEGDIIERSNGTTWESYSPPSVDETNVNITGGSISGITDLAIADGGTGASAATAAFDNLAPTTTAGDLIYSDGTNNVRLGIGTAGQTLRVNAGATAPEWVTGGSGVSGPVSSTDGVAALWDGTGGNTLKDSALAVGASDITIGGNGVYRAGGTDVPVADGGTGVSSLTAYAVVCGGTTSTGAVQSIASVGTSGQVLTSNGAGALPTFQNASGGGKVVQVVNTQTGAVATGTTSIPLDDTIPQNTEGTEFMSLSITPTSASNKLKIDVVAVMSPATAAWLLGALFRDSGANAVAATVVYQDLGPGTLILTMTHVETAGSTSATTFKFRGGSQAGATVTFNGSAGNRRMGGVMASSITITEFVP